MGSHADNLTSPPVFTSEGFTPFTLDPSHPFYVHPSDNPGSKLVHVPFNGHGFVLWRSSMLSSLSAKNKLVTTRPVVLSITISFPHLLLNLCFIFIL